MGLTVRRAIRATNRIVCFSSLVYAVWYLDKHNISPAIDPNRAYMGIWKYMTIWTAVLHAAFYAMCMLHELLWYLKFKTEKFSFRGLIYHALVVPMGLAVFLHFWLLYISDRELIQPKRLDHIIPPHINHIVHTLILPGLLIEGAAFCHPLPSRRQGITLLLFAQLIYGALVFYLGLTRNNWVYPFMGMLPMPLRVAFAVISTLVVVGYYLIGEALHKLVWRQKLKSF